MKKILSFILFALMGAGFACHAQQVITATVTITNVPTNGFTINVNGNVRTWTNTVTSASTQIANTNSIGAATTNLLYSYVLYPLANMASVRVSTGTTNTILLTSTSGAANTIIFGSNWATVTYLTNPATPQMTMFRGFASQVGNYERTNTANGIASYLSDNSVTNPIPLTAPAFSLFASLNSSASSTNFALNLSTNATNWARMLSTNATNLTLTLSTNDTNFALALSTNATNWALSLSTNSTNYILSTSNALYLAIGTGGGGPTGALPLAGGTMTGNILWNNNAVPGIVFNNLNATQMNALPPTAGAVIYNTTDKLIYFGNGTTWFPFQGNGPTFLPLSGGTMTGLIAWNTTTSAGLQLNNLSTTQRNALSATNGMMVYDTNLDEVEAFVGGVWQALGATTQNITVSNITLNGTAITNVSPIIASFKTTTATGPVAFFTVPATGLYRISAGEAGSGGQILSIDTINLGTIIGGNGPGWTGILSNADVVSYTTTISSGTAIFMGTVEALDK